MVDAPPLVTPVATLPHRQRTSRVGEERGTPVRGAPLGGVVVGGGAGVADGLRAAELSLCHAGVVAFDETDDTVLLLGASIQCELSGGMGSRLTTDTKTPYSLDVPTCVRSGPVICVHSYPRKTTSCGAALLAAS